MVYTAQSLSLAALEMVVHLPEDALLYKSYIRIPVQFDPAQVIDLALSTLPEDWNSNPLPESTLRIGSAWIYEKSSLVLKVPSSTIPTEHNYLINPLHPEAAELNIGTPAPFRFDSRIKH